MSFAFFLKKTFLRTICLILILCSNICTNGCQLPGRSHSIQGVYHTIQPGQTLFRIAKIYDLNLEILKKVNEIRDTKKIAVGRRIWVPGARRVLSFRTQNFPMPESPEMTNKKIQELKKTSKPGSPFTGFLSWPINGGILTSKFGTRWGRNHDGIDISSRTGTIIRAAAKGKVVFSGKGPKGYGLMIIIKHAKNLITIYAHNSVNHVGRNMLVNKGQKIALVGSTGRSTGPHLHFEVRSNTYPVNPLKYLSPNKVNQIARR